MSQNNGLPVKWMLLMMIVLAVMIIWMFLPKTPKDINPRNQAILTQEQPAIGKTQSQDENVSQVDTKDIQGHQVANKSLGMASQDQDSILDKNQEVGTATAKVANPVKTDEQVLAEINHQQELNEMVDKAVSNRLQQIDTVHEAVMNHHDSGEAQPLVAPRLTPPSDIAEKLRSHQLTGK